MNSVNYITASCTIYGHTVYKNRELVFTNKYADLTGFLLSVYQWLDQKYARFYKMDNLSKLGWLASEVLLKNSFDKNNTLPEETGLVLTNASSSLDSDLAYAATLQDMPSPALFVYTLPNIMIGEICIRNGFKGETAFFVFERFDAGFMEQYVNSLLNNGNLKSCICGWVELVKNEYKSVLFLVEKKQEAASEIFNRQNMTDLFQLEK